MKRKFGIVVLVLTLALSTTAACFADYQTPRPKTSITFDHGINIERAK